MKTPQYYKQEKPYTCSLAVLRMVLNHHGQEVSEQELYELVEEDYGKDFRNLWNPTLAKLSVKFGTPTSMYALWPLLKPEMLEVALKEYEENPEGFNVNKYENPDDKDVSTEPLPLAYKEMFEAVKLGCKVGYENITPERITEVINSGELLQTSIKIERMYPELGKTAFHSILLFGLDGDDVIYHDPAHGESMRANINHVVQAASNVGAFMIYHG